MALADQVGLTGPEYEVYIERGKIREFVRAMDAPLPEFLEGIAPVTPPTFLVCAPYTWGYTLERPRGTIFADIEHDLTVSLHAEESFEFHGTPPRAGEKLIAQPKLEKAWEKHGSNGGKLTFLTILNEYRDENGTLRAEQRSTSVTTEAAPGEGKWKPEVPDYDPDYAELERKSPFSEVTRQQLDALEQNQGPGPVTTPPLLKQEIVRFQGVVGEDDPLHHDPEWASNNDYPSVFALGTHQASLMSAYASHWLSPEAVRSFKVRFREVMWPGDQFTYSGIVTELNRTTQTATVHLTCKRKDETLVCEAWATYDFS
ncbi:MAG: MaoC family dehydratase N-terminal domain-containing protein [Pseudomonadota bacterium]